MKICLDYSLSHSSPDQLQVNAI